LPRREYLRKQNSLIHKFINRFIFSRIREFENFLIESEKENSQIVVLQRRMVGGPSFLTAKKERPLEEQN